MLPELQPVAGGRIGGGAHPCGVERFAIGTELQGEDSAGIIVAFDDSPTGEARSRPIRNFFAGAQVPDLHLAHEIAGGEKLVVWTEHDRLHRWCVRKRTDQFTGLCVEDFNGRLLLGSRLIFISATDILARDGSDKPSVWREIALP